MNSRSPVVVKVGGSLLTLPNLAERLQSVVQSLDGQCVLMVVGGGDAADEVRRLDGCFGLSPGKTHWDAVAAMSLNAKVLSRVLGCVPVVSNQIEAESAWKNGPVAMLDTLNFLRNEQFVPFEPLPESWDVTSDSIAAFVALYWPSNFALFCKSCSPVSPHIQDICRAGQFDAWLPNLLTSLRAADVQMSWLDLQANNRIPALRLN